MNLGTGSTEFSSSSDGALAYAAGAWSFGEHTLVWVGHRGAVEALPAPARGYLSPRLSPGGERLAVSIPGANAGSWVYDMARGTLARLSESTVNPRSIWTPDGKHLTFMSAPGGALNIYWMPADGSTTAERLTAGENFQLPGSWSPDRQVLAFSEADPTTGWDIWVLALQGDRRPCTFSKRATMSTRQRLRQAPFLLSRITTSARTARGS